MRSKEKLAILFPMQGLVLKFLHNYGKKQKWESEGKKEFILDP